MNKEDEMTDHDKAVEAVKQERTAAVMREYREVIRQVKKSLKGRTKSEIVSLAIHQASRALEYQAIAQQLFEEIKELKSQLQPEKKEENE